MVFPSIPVYLDPPNWAQQQPNQQPGVATQNLQVPPPQQPPPSIVVVGGGGHQGSTRPGSMTDRARLAKITQPEAALKCPRCESTNTKFCYYNNYSLSQPRHFCKTCRRYWTRGGALRNVPVGGGCRRNKRSKRTSRSKSPTKAGHGQAGSYSTSANSSSGCPSDAIGHLPCPAPSELLFPTSHHYSDYVSGNIGLHFGAILPPASVISTNGNVVGSDAEFQIGSSSGGDYNCGPALSNGLTDQWKLPMPSLQQVHQQPQQFPFMTNLEPPIGSYQSEREHAEPPSYGVQLRSKTLYSGSSGLPQLTSVKMEENQVLGLSKNILGSSGNEQFWAGNGNNWNDIPSFTSTSHLM